MSLNLSLIPVFGQLIYINEVQGYAQQMRSNYMPFHLNFLMDLAWVLDCSTASLRLMFLK